MNRVTRKPKSGRRMNWQHIPVRIAFLLLSCSFIWEISTVALMPNTSRKRRTFPAMELNSATTSAMVSDVCTVDYRFTSQSAF